MPQENMPKLTFEDLLRDELITLNKKIDELSREHDGSINYAIKKAILENERVIILNNLSKNSILPLSAKNFLKNKGIEDRVLNREDLPEFWVTISQLLNEFKAL